MIRLTKSSFYQENQCKKDLVEFIMNTDIFSMGEQCAEFEQAFAKKQNRKYAVLVNSGSSANLVLIQSLLNKGLLQKGDKVGFSVLTWPTNVMPLIQLGLIPVPIDCEIETLNVSPRLLSKKISDIKCLFLTNLLGFADDLPHIKEVCQQNNTLLVEDNCESLGSKIDGCLLGNYGLASTFSFYVGHHLSTIEGGIVCCDDDDLYQMLNMTRAHGWDRNLNSTLKEELRKKDEIDDFYEKFTFYDLAFNLRPTEITGFLGSWGIKHWDAIVKKRENNFHLFNTKVNKNPTLISLKLDHMQTVSNFAMPLIFKNKEKMHDYVRLFTENNVEIRPVVSGNICKQPFYKKYLASEQYYSNANFIHEQSFYFPNNPELDEAELDLLLDLVSSNI